MDLQDGRVTRLVGVESGRLEDPALEVVAGRSPLTQTSSSCPVSSSARMSVFRLDRTRALSGSPISRT